jgi:hypothetical protein
MWTNGILLLVTGVVVGLGFGLALGLGRPEWVYGAVGLVWSMLAIVWLAQHRYDGWRWNGPGAVALLALSIIMGAFSGGFVTLVDVLDGDGSSFVMRATAIYEWLSMAFVMTLVSGLVGAATWFLLVNLREGRAARLGARRHYSAFGEDTETIAKRVASMESLSVAVRALDVVITMVSLMMLTAAIALAAHFWLAHGTSIKEWIDDRPTAAWRGLVDLSSGITVLMVIGAFALIRWALRDQESRRKIGIAWDVASFWPRSFHPFAPPAYASRAAPELQARLTEIVRAAGEDGSGSGHAILSGHSQGSVLSLAAVASLPTDIAKRVWLVTHGSPLRRLYQYFFPRYFPESLFDHCAERLGDERRVAGGSWSNFWRSTDPIGDTVFAEGRDPTAPSLFPSVEKALAESRSRTAELPDVRLFDPARRTPSPYEPPPAVRGHSGYMADPAMSGAIEALAKNLTDNE